MLPSDPAALPLLHHGRLEVTGRIIEASNATLLCTVDCDGV
ncbi:MAG: phosphatidylinositol kinase, partial [Pseudonocardiales bacterium]